MGGHEARRDDASTHGLVITTRLSSTEEATMSYVDQLPSMLYYQRALYAGDNGVH